MHALSFQAIPIGAGAAAAFGVFSFGGHALEPRRSDRLRHNHRPYLSNPLLLLDNQLIQLILPVFDQGRNGCVVVAAVGVKVIIRLLIKGVLPSKRLILDQLRLHHTPIERTERHHAFAAVPATRFVRYMMRC